MFNFKNFYIMKELRLEKMEELEGGINGCEAVFFGVVTVMGGIFAVATAGASAVAAWGLTTYIGAIGLISC